MSQNFMTDIDTGVDAMQENLSWYSVHNIYFLQCKLVIWSAD